MSIFDNLIIFEMANSHQGSVEHGINIIKEMGKIARKYQVRAAVKLQYRQLDTFIHPDYKQDQQAKHISRFLSTRLQREDFDQLVAAIRAEGMLAISTPFDEGSVDWCVEQNLDIIKIASCSAQDWPLLEKVAASKKPVIISTGGLHIKDIDKIYNFFLHKKVKFSLMHCLAVYPAPMEDLQLDLLNKFKCRYPAIAIGYSGHEDPNDIVIASMAVAKGAKLLERHVGLPTETISLNKYSMNPAQAEKWVEAIVRARKACQANPNRDVSESEKTSLSSLMRGVYAKRDISKGEKLTQEDVFFAMPLQEGQLVSGKFKVDMIADKDYPALSAITQEPKPSVIYKLRESLHEAKGLLNEAGLVFGEEFEIEMSHHYGKENFRQTGCTIVNVLNREYCKKLIVMLPQQKHPSHYHQKKEESFQILYGTLELILNGEKHILSAGQTITVKRGDLHSFSSETGAIFEEISTTHYRNDSFYEDPAIANLDPMERKSFLEMW